MSKLTLAEAKVYLRIDSDYVEEDSIIASLMQASESYILDKVKKEKYNDIKIVECDLFKLCQLIYIAHRFENRGDTTGEQVNSVPHSIDAIISHISLCGDYV